MGKEMSLMGVASDLEWGRSREVGGRERERKREKERKKEREKERARNTMVKILIYDTYLLNLLLLIFIYSYLCLL